ncbi:Vacuolar cation-transporting ATPase YPK9 [Spathaspora sp. JA1]|nr:Vacuolar cation-transporting ATPase YPK9 [Spathaspora sp. JA1]
MRQGQDHVLRRSSTSFDKLRRSSLSRTRSRSRSRADSITSQTSSSASILVEDNNHEMFSGATSEIIPSSITSLHYPHHFLRRSSKAVISRETSPLLSGAEDEELEEEAVMLDQVTSRGGSIDITSHFNFFSPDEIEQAQGGSTLENKEDPVDYNTNWDYSVDKFQDEEVEFNQVFASEREEGSPTPDYGSLNFDRRRTRSDSDESNRSVLLGESRETVEESTFYKQYPGKLKYQRYYLAEEDIVIGIAGYCNCWWRLVLYYIICITTLGMGYLVLRWFPKYRVNLMGKRSPLGMADWCVIENEFGELQIVDINRQRFEDVLTNFMPINDEEEQKEVNPVVPYLHSFTYRYIKFFYHPLQDIFKTNSNWFDNRWLNIKTIKDGIPYQTHQQRLDVFGENKIEIVEKSISQLLIEETLHPFYIFQVFSIFLWLADDYYYYASCIFIISMISIVNSLIETKSTMKRLQQMSQFTCDVRVWRNGFWKQIDSSELVPGDIFELDPSLTLIPCDCLLINGECVINESMLTGESVPVTKTMATKETVKLLTSTNFIDATLSKSFLFNGTKLLKIKSKQAEEPIVTAMAIRTGFNTTKGSLIRSMLFPKPTGFKFYRDSFKYIGFMTIIAALGFTYSTYNFIQLGISKRIMILRALDIITIVVPPALPATLTIGTTFAISRLKKLQIFCISPTRVNIAGKLDILCFDKTGTLTEDGLDVLGVHLANNAIGRKEIIFGDLLDKVDAITGGNNRSAEHSTNNGKYLLGCMTTCHSLRSIDNELLGDPLDVKMFGFTNWNYNEENNHPIVSQNNIQYEIIHEFEFLASLRRMSVVTKNKTDLYVFTKGAPEVIREICQVDTLPSNYDDILHHYTHSGYRVIACGYKPIKQISSRESVESDLVFTGFIIFENKLKKSTKDTLTKLQIDGQIRTVMCTGDNILTAISVARECQLISDNIDHIYIPMLEYKQQDDEREYYITWEEVNDPSNTLNPDTIKPVNIRHDSHYKLAITGDIFRILLTEIKNQDLIHNILMNCDVFARMSPDEKHELVEQLQRIDYTVGFCGDGANDCGALKAADVGISLSEAEASVAAPFTSRIFEISCVLDVIKQGRSSLVTSFSCFKYMSLYSAIQFITVTILYKTGTNLGDFQFLYIDLFLILPLAIFMSWSKPYQELIAKRPTANLVSPKILIPLICQIIVILIFQIILWSWVKTEPWYIKPVPGGDDSVKSSDNTVLFLFSNFQYIIIAMVLSQGPPYRESMLKNYPFMINIVVACIISLWMFTINGNSKLGDFMQLTNLNSTFYWYIVVFSVVNFAVMMIGEQNWFKKVAMVYKRIFQRSKIGKSKKMFKNLSKEFNQIQSV